MATHSTTAKSMKPFEKWQVGLGVLQTLVLLATLIGALYIGIRQNQISAQQAEISSQQTAISKALLDIPFSISVEVVYDPSAKRLDIFNKGQTNIYLWGTKLGRGPATMDETPVLITPGGFYYIMAESLEKEALAGIPNEGEARGDFVMYLKNQTDTKYVVTTNLFEKVANGQCTIHTQTNSIKQQLW